MRFFLRILHTAVRALRRNVMRSALTCLGIVIGVSAVIAVMEIGQGSSIAIQQAVASLGANFVQVEPEAASSSGVNLGAGSFLTLAPQDCDAIRAQCPAVRWAAPGVDCRMQVVYGGKNWQP